MAQTVSRCKSLRDQTQVEIEVRKFHSHSLRGLNTLTGLKTRYFAKKIYKNSGETLKKSYITYVRSHIIHHSYKVHEIESGVMMHAFCSFYSP